MIRARRLLCALTVTALFAVASNAHAQGFQSTYSKDGVDVWAVGEAGAVWRSFDGGASYTASTIGTATLRGLSHQGLVVVAVADGGRIWRSTNNGGTFALQTVAGAPNLSAVTFANATTGYVVGAGGTILKTIDGGANWAPQTSGTAQKLNAVAFTDASNGWAAGAAGTLLRTTDGGTNWSPVASGVTVDLFAVAQNGSTVWVGGDRGAALRSTNGGASFAPVNLRVDGRPAVRAIALPSASTVWLGGGGGFIRRSDDLGSTWTYPVHDMHGQTSSLFVVGTKVFATTGRYKTIVRSTNGGATFSLPSGMGLSRTWAGVRALGSFRGGTIQQNWYNPDILYAMAGATVHYSPDRGETWTSIATAPNVSSPNAFLVSDRDTNVFLAAITTPGGSRGVIRSEDRGATWTQTLTASFGTYGIPLEKHPDKPDTVVFGGDSRRLDMSVDGGKTWAPYGTKVFRSPCDIIIVPDSNAVWEVGDGITGVGIGDLWQSTDTGVNFTMRQLANGSEIPGMSISRARNSYSIGTTWSAAGARSSADFGGTWPTIAALGAYGSSWGTSTNADDPNVILIGQYSGGSSRLSLDGGTNYLSIPLSGTNYSFMAVDRDNLFAEQASQLYKMRFAYTYTPVTTQALTVSAPNGGEAWAAGTVRNVTWNSTNVGLARIEWRKSPSDPWTLVADVEGTAGTYAWVVPDEPTTTAEVRISDGWDASPVDVSNFAFTILAPRMVVTPGSLAFGAHDVGTASTLSVNVQSTGTSTLDITSVSTGTSAFTEGRGTFSLGAGASDTIGVTFRPTSPVAYGDTLTIVSNAGTVRVPLSGTGQAVGSISLTTPDGGQNWQYNSTHAITWAAAGIATVGIDYRTAPAGPWIVIANDLNAAAGTFDWVIPNAPTTTAAVRVRDMGGSFSDVSAATFSITVPQFDGGPAVLDLGDVEVNTSASGAFTVGNTGTAVLGVSAVACNNARFFSHRSAFELKPSTNDTTGVTFQPTTIGPDSATITFTTDDPAGSHTLRVRANGVRTVSVGGGRPTAFALQQNVPNPSTGRTLIRFSVPARSPVSLEVFDLQGHRVAKLVDGVQEPGEYTVPFSAMLEGGRGRLAAGVYFYRLQAPGFSATRRLLISN